MRLCRGHRTSPAPRDLTLKEYPLLLRAGPGWGERAVWGVSGGYGSSSPGQAPISQSVTEVAKLVTGL